MTEQYTLSVMRKGTVFKDYAIATDSTCSLLEHSHL